MSYQVLARKWRPPDFAALIGQEPIVTALRNALRDGRIAQAYLFSGIRGVGKTTAARILAKALNCERGPAEDPCNECRTCQEIAAGSDLDVLEVDAATYSKVEQIRELTESLKYGPARDRYKVVVLDEVHRLSRQAFDALLKIVEEPPPHLTFIFATTEVDAVPATILSRCQEFHFRRVPAETLAGYLRTICERESVEASDTALRLIARAGEGSVRDSVAILDQLATFGSGTIADQDAARVLGGVDTDLFLRLLGAVHRGDRSEVAAAVEQVESHGWDPRKVFAQFLSYCRDALHLAFGADPASVDLPHEAAAALAELSGEIGYENLLRILNLLLGAEPLVRRSEAAGIALEIAWLRAAEMPRLIAIDEILAGGTGSGPRSAAQPSPRGSRTPAASAAPSGGASRSTTGNAQGNAQGNDKGNEQDDERGDEKGDERVGERRPRSGVSATAASRSERSQAAGAAQPTPSSREARDPSTAARRPARVGEGADLAALYRELCSRRSSLRGLPLESLTLETVGERPQLSIRLAPDDLLRDTIERHREVIDAVLAERLGEGARLRVVDGERRTIAEAEPAPAERAPDGRSTTDELADIRSHPKVQAVLEIFATDIESVEEVEEVDGSAEGGGAD